MKTFTKIISVLVFCGLFALIYPIKTDTFIQSILWVGLGTLSANWYRYAEKRNWEVFNINIVKF
jgi:hypothetical protein